MTAIPLPTAETPLLSHSSSLEPKSLLGYNANTHGNNNIVSSTINDHELHFYNPAAILDVSREVAFAYLILLTGGAVEYVAPTALVKGGIDLETLSSSSPNTAQQQPQAIDSSKSHPPDDSKTVGEDDRSKKTTTNVNDESASLAYAAIVDGNVLHACFGLKSTPNGRISNNSVIPKNVGGAVCGGDGTTPPTQRSSYYSLFFCCFPLGGGASSPTLDALHLLLSNLSSNRMKMQHLVEILREIREMQLESSALGGVEGSAVSTGGGALYNISNSIAKSPLHLQVIHAYIHCFASIVRYHDAKDSILCCDTSCSPNGCGGRKKKKKKSKSNITCYEFIKNMNILSRKTMNSDPRLEQLRIDTLHDIEKGFHGLKEDIWESLERMATETSFTGCASLEESTSGGSSISKANRSANQSP